MMALTDAFAVAGVALVVCAAVLWLGVRRRLPGAALPWARPVAVLLFIGLLVPLPGIGMPLAGYIRGIAGDPSISLLVLSGWSVCYHLFGVLPMARREQSALLVVVAAAAVLLYPTALGWGDWDAYRLGWGSWWFLLSLLSVSAGAAWLGLRVLPALVALALLAWSATLMESGNLWDYLLDPWLSAFALGFVLLKCWQLTFRRLTHRSSF